MSERPWHKRYHSDALTGVMNLTLEQRGAYQTILDMLYDHGAPLVDNERLLAGYMNVSLRKYRTIRDQLIELGKIYLTDNGLISNRRFDYEILIITKTSRKRAENGSKGGTKNAENQKNTNKNNGRTIAKLEQKPSLLDIRDQIDKKEAKASQKKGTRLSNDWELPDDWLEWAVNEGLRQSQAFLEAKKFRDYWVAKSGVGATKCDWLATWRNWVRNTIERQQPKQSKQERISDDIAEFKRAASKAYG